MELELWVVALLCATFLLTGILDGISGGGGLITLPALLLTGLPPEAAFGTNKIIAYTGAIFSLGNYARSGYVVWKTALTGIPVIVASSMLGAYLLLLLDSAAIGKVVVFFLPLGALATFMPRKEKAARDLRSSDLYVRLPLVCLGMGLYDGFFGPGSGTFLTIALHVFLGLSLIPSVATSKMIGVAGSVGSGFIFIAGGHVLWALAVPCALANIAGNIIGSTCAMRIGTGLVRRFLIFSLILLFGSLVWKFWIEG